MEISGIVAVAAGVGLAAGLVLGRFGRWRMALWIAGLAVVAAVALILAGRAEGGFGGIGMVAVATVMVAPFAAGVALGAVLPRLFRR